MIVERGVLEPGFRPAASVDDALNRAGDGCGVAWIALQDPGEAELKSICTAVGHRQPARLVAGHKLGHTDLIGSPDHHQITLLEVDATGTDLPPVVLQILVGRSHLVVLRRGGAENAVTDLRRRTEEWLAELTDAAPKVWEAVVALLLVHFEDYDRLLQGIEDAVEHLNDRLFPVPDGTILKDAHHASQWIARSGRAVRLLAQGLAEAAADDQLATDAEVRRAIVRLRRVAEDLVQRVAWAEQTVSSLAGALLGLTGQRTNDLSARQAAVAQRISAYALLFAIPNAMFAFYGTNFEHLPTILTRQYGYAVLLGITAALMAVATWRLRRSGWL